MRVVIAGSSGFLGSHLVDRLRRAGHDVRRLVRRTPENEDETAWDPAAGAVDPRALSGVDAVVNLAGAGVADRRWTRRYKGVIRASRVNSTATLARAIAAAESGPRVLLNASAVGWYGDTGDTAVTEDSPHGEGFLADLARVWEGASAAAEDADVRVAKLRTGHVLAASGGLLKRMVPIFKLGVGGRLGSGRQYMPWITLEDWLRAVLHLLDHDLDGPVNLVSPHPATNAELTKALGAALHRPAILPVPSPALRIVLGELAGEGLASQRALPGVLTKAGFEFTHPELKPALDWALQH